MGGELHAELDAGAGRPRANGGGPAETEATPAGSIEETMRLYPPAPGL